MAAAAGAGPGGRADGAGRSLFSGMIGTEAGVHPNVSALVYVAARAGRRRRLWGLAARFPAPPASAGIVYDGDEGRLSEEAFLRDFGRSARRQSARPFAVQEPFQKTF